MSYGDRPVAVAPLKSAGLALMLTILLGPLGLLYASVGGGIFLSVVSMIAMPFTFGLAGLVLWPVSVIWALIAVARYNARLTKSPQSEAVATGTHPVDAIVTVMGMVLFLLCLWIFAAAILRCVV